MTGLTDALVAALGDDVLGVDDGFGPPTLDVAPGAWEPALAALHGAGATYFDFLSAYDELDEGFAVVAHVSTPDAADHVLVRTRVPREAPVLPTATGVYRGASWHERETYEMFGVEFEGHPHLVPLLLPDGFEGRPLRKDFVLASRVVKDWPGGKDPADPPGGGPARRKIMPPGVPTDWLQDESDEGESSSPSLDQRGGEPEQRGGEGE